MKLRKLRKISRRDALLLITGFTGTAIFPSISFAQSNQALKRINEITKGLGATESDIYLDNPNYPISGAKTMFSGGAGLSSTAYDYSLFLSMLLNEGEYGEKRLLSQNSVKLMRTALIDRDGDGNSDFGLGFDVITHPKKFNELSSFFGL